MSLYLEYKTDFSKYSLGNTDDLVTTVLATAWSSTDQPVLASSSADGSISFFNEEGVALEMKEHRHLLNRQPAVCNKLAWHPRLPILAMGWSDGCVSVFDETTKILKVDTLMHVTPITFITWSPEGSRLITGDERGFLAVWDRDNSRKLRVRARHEKEGPITHLCFRAPEPGSYSNYRLVSCPPFFFGGAGGRVYFGSDFGGCSDVVHNLAPMLTMYYNCKNDYLVLLTTDLTLYKFKISKEGKMRQEKKITLSAKQDGKHMQCEWAGSGLLAAANQENLIRMLHLEDDNNYFLTLQDARHGADSKDIITCVAFNPRKRILAGGCLSGRVVMWRHSGNLHKNNNNTNSVDHSSADDWEVLPSIMTEAQHALNGITALDWGETDGLLSITSSLGVSILNETTLHCRAYKGNNVIQVTDDTLYAEYKGLTIKVSTDIRVKGLGISDKYAVVYNGQVAEVRDFSNGNDKLISTFASKASSIAIHNDEIYCGVGSAGRVEVCNLSGVMKKAIDFADHEGAPQHVFITGDVLAVTTNVGLLKLWNIRRANPKALVPGRLFNEAPPGSQIRSVRVNCDGTRVSLIMHRTDMGVSVPCSEIFVYDVEMDKLNTYDFGPHFYPTNHFWDDNEAKLFVVETLKFDAGHSSAADTAATATATAESKAASAAAAADGEDNYIVRASVKKTVDKEATTLFATQEDGVLMQDSFPVAVGSESLMGMSVPYIYFMQRSTDSEGEQSHAVKEVTMRDFVGMETVDDSTKKDLMSFSYFLTIGNMDEAYRAVKRISSETVWENMAKMCVKNKRLDVAEVCFSNMKNARGCKAIREAKREPDKESQVAMVAIQLGLLDDAERLYREASRWDLLVKLYIAAGRWHDALAVCTKHDRIRLKTTHYLFARHLESLGYTKQAIKHYELSDTHTHEVPRMLYDRQGNDSGALDQLERYVTDAKTSDAKSLSLWWAKFQESTGDFDNALEYYKIADDVASQVRILTYNEEYQAAEDLCQTTKNRAACFKLARLFESNEQINEAIAYYSLAHRHNHAARLARENGMEAELLALSMESGGTAGKLQAAEYFESIQNYEKAVMLYTKAGHRAKALDLAFKGRLFDQLNNITENLGADADPALLQKCATFFMENEQYDKAVHLFATANNIKKALEICQQYDCKITEELAQKLTPDKSDKAYRRKVLVTIADALFKQGSFHLACKKYTQGYQQVKGMQALLRTNDADLITRYAARVKKAPIFILAANYLQNLDWQNDAKLEKSIVTFYNRAKAYTQLAMFYDTQAIAEIDHYTDYEKALVVLRKAFEILTKSTNPTDEPLRETLSRKILLVEKFVQARTLQQENPHEMLAICEELLAVPSIDNDVRLGDLYDCMIRYYVANNHYQEAYDCLQAMQEKNVNLRFIKQHIIDDIYAALDISPEQANNNNNNNLQEDGDDMEMEVNISLDVDFD